MDQDIYVVAIGAGTGALLLWPLLRQALFPVVRITPAEVKERLDRHEDMLVLDVRTPEEFTGPLGHIQGAVNIALHELGGRVGAVKDALAAYREAPVVVVCRSGARADRAARLLKRAGLGNVRILAGGMLGWSAARLPVSRHG